MTHDIAARPVAAGVSPRGPAGDRVLEGAGRHRWGVERTLAWLGCYRRLRVRDERRADIYEAFLKLGCTMTLLSYLQKIC